jgi:hypothetical protein
MRLFNRFGNDANDIALESYGSGATFSFRLTVEKMLSKHYALGFK